MSQASRIENHSVEELPHDLAELRVVLDALPAEIKERVMPIFTRAVEGAKRRRRILSLVQDALSQLRLDLKYLMFDLDATRRERDEYLRRLEENR